MHIFFEKPVGTAMTNDYYCVSVCVSRCLPTVLLSAANRANQINLTLHKCSVVFKMISGSTCAVAGCHNNSEIEEFFRNKNQVHLYFPNCKSVAISYYI